MPAERTPMRHVREVLRLKFVGGVPTREIARRIGVAASTVRATIKRFQAAGLSWPVAEDDPPPLKWSDLKYVFWHQGGPICRGRSISLKRLSRS
jgi:Sigma-70, region 4